MHGFHWDLKSFRSPQLSTEKRGKFWELYLSVVTCIISFKLQSSRSRVEIDAYVKCSLHLRDRLISGGQSNTRKPVEQEYHEVVIRETFIT